MTNEKTLIILDTNFLKEGNQNSKIYSTLSSRNDFKEFINFLEKNKIKEKIIFGIPEITFEEHFYHKNKDFNLDLENLREKVSQFNQMEILENGKLDLKFKDSFNYRDFLNKFIKTNDSFVLFRIPEDKKKELFDKTLEKAINHQKPFHKKGDRNLKDSLIWECICCQDFREYAVVLFLTQNEDDFPKNNEIDDINYASEKTGKLIRILYKYDDLEKELEKIYMFVEMEIKKYILDYFKDRIKEDIENTFDCIVWDFNLKEDKIKIKNVEYLDLKEIEMEEALENKDNLRIVNLEIDAETEYAPLPDTVKETFFGKVIFDNSVKEIIWSNYERNKIQTN